MSLCLGAACKLSYWSECLGKNASAEPSTKDGIEAVRLCAFTPPGSSLDPHSVVVFPLTINNPAWVAWLRTTRNYESNREPLSSFRLFPVQA
jgi:hypothetical protein